MILVSVYDKKSATFAPPIAFEYQANAVRSYVGFARSKVDSNVVQFASDYDLYDVGMFHPVSGVIEPCIPPNFIESMTNIVAEARKVGNNG